MEIISRKDAKAQGLKHYFTGKPCKHGHINIRYVSSYRCVKCCDEYNKEYYKEYYENNRERIKEYYENNKEYYKEYYENNRERIKEYNKEYRENNKERIKEYKKEYRENNKERIKEYKKEYRENNKERIKEYYENNKERIKECIKEYRENNKEQFNRRNARRRAKKLNATPTWANKDKIALVYEGATFLTEHGSPTHVDHIYPLQADWVCGLHVHENLMEIPARDNITKGNRIEQMPNWIRHELWLE